jgi:hypothetical protein
VTHKAGAWFVGAVGAFPFLETVMDDDSGVGPAPAESVRLWCDAVRSMGPDELESFEERTFRQWDRASLGDVRRAIERRRREFAG